MKITNILMILTAMIACFESAAPMLVMRCEYGNPVENVDVEKETQLVFGEVEDLSLISLLGFVRSSWENEVAGIGFCEEKVRKVCENEILFNFKKVSITRVNTGEQISVDNTEGKLYVYDVQKDSGFVIDTTLKREFIEVNGKSFFAYYNVFNYPNQSKVIVFITVYEKEGDFFKLRYIFGCFLLNNPVKRLFHII